MYVIYILNKCRWDAIVIYVLFCFDTVNLHVGGKYTEILHKLY